MEAPTWIFYIDVFDEGTAISIRSSFQRRHSTTRDAGTTSFIGRSLPRS